MRGSRKSGGDRPAQASGGVVSSVVGVFTDWRSFPLLMALILLFEAVFTAVVIRFIAYTEIDWKAYMQEVEGFLGGETDYLKLRGDTGPLVYPAGFVYIFSGLYYATWTEDGGYGSNILLGQVIYWFLYMATTWVVLDIYKRAGPASGCPPWAALLLVVSKRVHSIFVLRLFNDCIAMLFLYIAVALLCRSSPSKWLWACVSFSWGVAVKMNVLLFAPALLLLMLRNVGLLRTVFCLFVCAAVQIVLGLPFLVTYPVSYLSKAFELSRVFFFKWTVNWKFLDPDVFTGKPLATVLLAGHLVFLVWFTARWLRRSGLPNLSSLSSVTANDGPAVVAITMFTSNFIGIAFARTLHYQFYCWYFHSLPLLLWGGTNLPTVLRLAVIAGIEFAFNVFPATPLSSGVLQAAHVVLLVGLWWSAPDVIPSKDKPHAE